MADLEKISSGVISGDDAGVAELTQKAIDEGVEPAEII
ncbi:MAG TPA: cobalamin-binding protein, partial [Firmicutes bacterium]|nr:cobalamin-binding protein [Bacillota bacterium]